MTPTKCAECGLDVDAELERRSGVVMCVVGDDRYCARCMQRPVKPGERELARPAQGAKR